MSETEFLGVLITNTQPNITSLGVLSSLQVSGITTLNSFEANSILLQENQPLVLGKNAGQISQGTNAIAIGTEAGRGTQGSGAISIGFLAGQTFQGTNSIAIGYMAGQGTQGENAIAIGVMAGQTNQGSGSIAIGYLAGSQQANNTVIISALGTVVTGETANSTYIAPIRSAPQTNVLGYNTLTNELTYYGYPGGSSVPNGTVWGQGLNWNDSTNQWQITGDGPLAFGNNAGQSNQGTATVAIGVEAGRMNQNSSAVAIGIQAGQMNQGENAIAIGVESAETNQGSHAIAIGTQSGQVNQGSGSIAIGFQSGLTNQGINAIAIGNESGETNQGSGSIAIGLGAGQWSQGQNAIAIGNFAGRTNQGSGSIAIGFQAGSQQANNTIVISSLVTVVTGATANATYMAPLRNTGGNLLAYETTTNEVSYFNAAELTTNSILFYTDLTRGSSDNTLSDLRIYTVASSVNTGSTVNVNWIGSQWLYGSSTFDSVGTYYSQLIVPAGVPNFLTVYVGGWRCGQGTGKAKMRVVRSGVTICNRHIGFANNDCTQFLVPLMFNDFQEGDILSFQVNENNKITSYNQIYTSTNYPAGRLFITR